VKRALGEKKKGNWRVSEKRMAAQHNRLAQCSIHCTCGYSIHWARIRFVVQALNSLLDSSYFLNTNLGLDSRSTTAGQC